MADVDVFELNENGSIDLEWTGQDPGTVHRRHLRRPTLREYRILVEQMGELAGKSVAGKPASSLGHTLEWMKLVFEGSEELGLPGLSDQPLPGEDDLPSWLVAGEVPSNLVSHWQQ